MFALFIVYLKSAAFLFHFYSVSFLLQCHFVFHFVFSVLFLPLVIRIYLGNRIYLYSICCASAVSVLHSCCLSFSINVCSISRLTLLLFCFISILFLFCFNLISFVCSGLFCHPSPRYFMFVLFFGDHSIA